MDDVRKTRLNIIDEMKKEGIVVYPYRFDVNISSVELHKRYGGLKNEESREDEIYSIAGRVKAKRKFGKLIFLDIDDYDGKIQACAKADVTPTTQFSIVKRFIDVGDIVGIKGYVFRTKRGELTVMILDVCVLSKALLPLPEKWHGLKDYEDRYRKRYLDLIMNPEVREVFKKRFETFKYIRKFMDEKGFDEVEVPILQPVYGGAFAKPFISHSNAWETDMYLSISPELYLKRLLIGGMKQVYSIARCFRNEDVDRWHNPEFTQMEAYWAYKDYTDMMDLAEELISGLVEHLHGTTTIEYQGVELDFERPWKRIRFIDALKKYADIDFDTTPDEEIKKMLKENEIELPVYNRGLAMTELFEKYCEDKFIEPTFVIDYPKESTPLCKLHRKDDRLVERFELFVNGIELANAYSELNDPVIQRKLLEEQVKLRKLRGEYHPMDYDFVEALEYGMPPAGGIGIGLDRLVMILTNSPSIREVILFPQLRPVHRQGQEEGKK